jgi:hypothetical protein
LAQVRAAIVVDMIADAHLDIHRDLNSTPWLSAQSGQLQALPSLGTSSAAPSPSSLGPPNPQPTAATRGTPSTDGEEAVKNWSSTDGLFGSRHLSARLAADGNQARVRAVIVVDMIADAHLDIHRKTQSTPWLNEIVFTQANRLGFGRFFLDDDRPVQDDHVPFLEHGLPTVDIIDLDYGPLNLFWHSRRDELGKCSPGSFAVVGQVVIQSPSRVGRLR